LWQNATPGPSNALSQRKYTDSGRLAAVALRLFLQKAVPLHDLFVDVGCHAVPMFELFAAREHERPKHHATNHAICNIHINIIIIVVVVVVVVVVTSAGYSGPMAGLKRRKMAIIRHS